MRISIGTPAYNQRQSLAEAHDSLERKFRPPVGSRPVPPRRATDQERTDIHPPDIVNPADHPTTQPALRAPVLSVAIPTYNRADTLRRQLGSLLGQIIGCQHDVELVVSDNASSDGTESVVAEIREQFPNVRYVRNPENIGLLRNVDVAVRACRAEYVWIVADDDVLMPVAVEAVVRAVQSVAHGNRPASFIFLTICSATGGNNSEANAGKISITVIFLPFSARKSASSQPTNPPPMMTTLLPTFALPENTSL